MEDNPYSSRRRFVATATALTLGGLAGCMSGEDGDAAASSGDQATETEVATDTPTDAPTETPTETPTESETPTPEPHTDLVLQNAQTLVIKQPYSEDIGGQVEITNQGDIATSNFTVGLDWLDENDEYIATSDLYGYFLEPGETWVARTVAWLDVDDPEQIESVEATVSDEGEPGRFETSPDGIELSNKQVRASEEEVLVRGTIKNSRDTKQFINVVAKVYDKDGNVLGIRSTIEEVASGDSWRFEVNPQTWGRNGEVDSAKVIPYLD
jgi:hypothetical protein